MAVRQIHVNGALFMSMQSRLRCTLCVLSLSNMYVYATDPNCLEPLSPFGLAGESLRGYNAVLLQEQVDHARLQLIEALDPETLVARGAIPVDAGERARGYDLNATHAYVADMDLSIYLITDLEQPQLLVTLPVLTSAQNVALTDDLALVKTAAGALEIYDISAAPTVAYQSTLWLPVGGVYARLTVRDMLACVVAVDAFGEVYLLDISEPSAPEMLATISGLAPQVAALQADQLVVGGQNMMYVFDITTPAQPQMLGSHALNGEAKGIVLAGDDAFIVTASGVTRFDLSVPSSPEPVDSVTAAPGFGVHRIASRLYLSDTLVGMRTFALDACEAGGTGDCDGNGSVDWPDFLSLDHCLSGPGAGGAANCACVDLDADGAQTIRDAALFQRRFGS